MKILGQKKGKLRRERTESWWEKQRCRLKMVRVSLLPLTDEDWERPVPTAANEVTICTTSKQFFLTASMYVCVYIYIYIYIYIKTNFFKKQLWGFGEKTLSSNTKFYKQWKFYWHKKPTSISQKTPSNLNHWIQMNSICKPKNLPCLLHHYYSSYQSFLTTIPSNPFCLSTKKCLNKCSPGIPVCSFPNLIILLFMVKPFPKWYSSTYDIVLPTFLTRNQVNITFQITIKRKN